MFQNGAGKALDPNNLLYRVILPALNVCGSAANESEHKQAKHDYERNKVLPEWQGWHAFRRGWQQTCIRWADLTIQAILRHSNVSNYSEVLHQDRE
jgi:hypothetical protein